MSMPAPVPAPVPPPATNNFLTDLQQSCVVWLAGLFLAVSMISVPLGAPWYVGVIMAILAAISLALKEALGSLPSTPPIPGIPNSAQAVLVFASSAAMVVGSVSVPAGHPFLSGALVFAGAIGLAVKEFLGSSAQSGGYSNSVQATSVGVGTILMALGPIVSTYSGNSAAYVLSVVGVILLSYKEVPLQAKVK